jgi:hypothetical protein
VPQQRFRDSAARASWTSIIGRRLTMARQTRCIDCNVAGIETTRPALKPGPRCEQHWRETRRKRSDAAHGKHLEKAFSITAEIYAYVKNKQGGVCYGCGRAKGKTKRLAVDHDHRCDAGHPPEFGCPKCIRALLCTYCNEVVGRLDADALRRLIEVHENPPAQRWLKELD